MVHFLFRAFSLLPFELNHALGVVIGWLAYLFSGRVRRLTRENIAIAMPTASLVEQRALERASIAESGKSLTELPIMWLRTPAQVASLVVDCRGFEHVEAARGKGTGLILLTPHVGCFEVAGRYLSSRLPLLFMFSPPKQAWLGRLMEAGRARQGADPASADLRGVRRLLKRLKEGGSVFILPDQVPGGGEGAWVDFFGRPAYTMTLVARLQRATGAPIVWGVAERLPRGGGYRLWIEPQPEPLAADPAIAARQLNAMVEYWVRRFPAQYYWSYNRYKHPAGAPLPPTPDS